MLPCHKNSRSELVPSPRPYARNGASRWLGDYLLLGLGLRSRLRLGLGYSIIMVTKGNKRDLTCVFAQARRT